LWRRSRVIETGRQRVAYVMRAMLGKRMHLLSVKKRDSGEEGTMPFEWRAGREVTLECQWYRM
jgi:hypothetical protein